VRPLQSILCTFDGEVVPFDVDGIHAGNTTRGHRFLSKGVITAKRFEDYESKLRKAHVIVDASARLETIRTEAKNMAFAQGLEMIEDEALLKEVAGLVEWPVVLMGEFDKAYLTVPPEVIITTIKVNQKCFCLRASGASRLAALAPQHEGQGKSPHPEVPASSRASKGEGGLSNKYLLVANIAPSDGGTEIIRGNNKVIAARLSDAKFFWDQDRKIKLEDQLPKLDTITFHAKLGTQGERVKRIEVLAGEIAKTIGADVEKAKLAARLAKADLVSGMVGEFPELEGLMGRYYALDQGHDAEVADAIRDHYKPKGPTDSLPVSKVGQAVALAEKLDTLVGFWAIDEKPTGSKDPFALRRAAQGVVRIVLENDLRLPLGKPIENAAIPILSYLAEKILEPSISAVAKAAEVLERPKLVKQYEESSEVVEGWSDHVHHGILRVQSELFEFVADRLRVALKDRNLRHDLLDAVFSVRPITEFFMDAFNSSTGESLSTNGFDDLYLLVKRIEALSKFLASDDGKNLLAGYKRAINILRAEEKKDATTYSGKVDDLYIVKAEERELKRVVEAAAALTKKAVDAEDFEGAMRAISKLRAPVDAFFEHVTVNDTDLERRANRLRLLNRIREAMAEVADFSKIEG
jgi:glycyl-tRNA synthetase beta chain